MSVALTSPPSTTTPAAVAAEERRVTQRSVVIAEWIKFRSVRSNVIALASAGVVLVLFGRRAVTAERPSGRCFASK